MVKQRAKRVFSLCLLLVAVLSSCTEQPESPDQPLKVIGYVDVYASGNSLPEYKLLDDLATKFGCRMLRIQSKRTNQAQIEVFRTLILYQVDAILCSPILDSGWDNVLQEAAKAGIPVVFLQCRPGEIPEELTYSYVAPDYEKIGLAAVGYLAKEYPQAADAHKPVSILEIFGTGGSCATKGIRRGLRKGFANTGFEIIYSVNGDFMRSKSKELSRGYLKNQTPVDVIFCQSYDMALGVLDACESTGTTSEKRPLLAVVGNSREIALGMEQGQFDCGICLDEKAYETAVSTAIHMARRQDVPEYLEIGFEVLSGKDGREVAVDES